jgi:hypothetical protein
MLFWNISNQSHSNVTIESFPTLCGALCAEGQEIVSPRPLLYLKMPLRRPHRVAIHECVWLQSRAGTRIYPFAPGSGGPNKGPFFGDQP